MLWGMAATYAADAADNVCGTDTLEMSQTQLEMAVFVCVCVCVFTPPHLSRLLLTCSMSMCVELRLRLLLWSRDDFAAWRSLMTRKGSVRVIG